MERTRGERRRRGMALAQAMLLGTLLTTLGMGLATLSVSTGRISDRRSLGIQALNVAQMGVEEACAGFAYNPDFIANGSSLTYAFSRPDTNSSATIQCRFVLTRSDQNVADASGNLVTVHQVTSVGTVTAGGTPAVSRRVRISLASPPGNNGVLNATIAAKKSLTIGGDLNVKTIASFTKIPHKGKTPDASVITNEARIQSNGDVTLADSASVGGDVSAAGTVTGAAGRVTGSVTEHVPPVWFPPITQEMKDQALVDGTTTGTDDLTISSGTVKGKYAIPPDSTVRITGDTTMPDNHTVWITGNLYLSGVVYGTGSVIVDGTITVDRTSASKMAGNIIFMTPSTANPAILYDGIHIFRGILYAPNGTLTVTGGPNISGSLIADTVNLSSSGGIYNDKSAPVPPNGLPRMLSRQGWEELKP